MTNSIVILHIIVVDPDVSQAIHADLSDSVNNENALIPHASQDEAPHANEDEEIQADRSTYR